MEKDLSSIRWSRTPKPGDARPSPPRITEVLPILILIGVVQLSVLLPANIWPGVPDEPTFFWISTGLLALLPVLFWNRYPALVLTPAVVYATSVLFLNLAAPPYIGLGLLFFLPVVGVALFGSRRQTAAIIAVVTIYTLIIAFYTHSSVSVETRRLLLYLSLSVVIAASIIGLRERLVRSRERIRLLLKGARAVNDMAQRFAVLTEPASISALAAELATVVGASETTHWRRGAFLTMQGGQLALESSYEDGSPPTDITWPAPGDRLLDEAINAEGICTGPIVPDDPQERPATDPAAYHAAWVKIEVEGRLQAALGVAFEGPPIAESSLQQLASLAHLVELALANWRSHQRLEQAATQEDRRRIARDLHDGLAQELAFIASKSTTVASLTPGADSAKQLAYAAERALDEARRAIALLSETSEPLQISLSQTVEDLAERHGMSARVDLSSGVTLCGEATENVIRIVREALTNAARHGRADAVAVTLREEGPFACLVIADNGHGFEPSGRSEEAGFGLRFMHERCERIGGSLTVRSAPGAGTQISLLVPR